MKTKRECPSRRRYLINMVVCLTDEVTKKLMFFGNKRVKVKFIRNKTSLFYLCRAIALAYNLPEIRHLKLIMNLTREQVVGIFNGTYNYWNDSTFQTSNPNVQMPNRKIIVVVRRGKSGTTGIFTSALSAFSQSWKDQYGFFLKGINETTDIPYNWNDTVIDYYGKQSSGLAGIVASFKYSIGYISVSESKGLQLDLANIKNKAGYFIRSNNETTVQNAINEHLTQTKSLTGSLVDLSGQNSYPIAGFTYMLIRLSVTGSCVPIKELVRYIEWFSTSEDAKNFCIEQGMVPITNEVAEQIKSDVLKKITCNGASVWTMVEDDKLMEKYMSETWRTPVAATAPFVILLILALFGYIIHQRLKLMKMINNDEWNINIEDILFYFEEKWVSSKSRLIYNKSVKSLKSLDDIPDGDLILSQILQWPGRWKAHQIGIRLLNMKGLSNIDRRTKRELIWMRDQVIHKNVLRFYGLTEVDADDKYVVSEYSSKGPLLDVLQDEKFNLTEDFKFSLSVDIASGMSFLHTLGIIHGNLRSSCCMLDSRWMVKIADWEYCRLYSVIHPTRNPIIWMRKDADEIGEYASAFRDFWTAPEILKSSFTRFPTNSSDVYSFAIILQEIFTRDDPYVEHADTMNPNEVLNTIKFHNLRPQPTDDLPLSVRQTMEIAWSDNPASRPSFDQILKMLKHAKPSRKSVLDSMMEAMEEYTIHLEERIEERTNELNTAKQTMEEQLSRFIPKPLVSNLMNDGQYRLKEYGNNCILATELYDFKRFVSTNTPERVVSVLQKVHTLIEGYTDRRQVYHVAAETGTWVYIAGLDPDASDAVQNTVTLAHLALDCQESMMDQQEFYGLQLRSALHIGNIQASYVVSPNSVYVLGNDLYESKRLLYCAKSFEIRISQQVKEILSADKNFEIQSGFESESKVSDEYIFAAKFSLKFWQFSSLRVDVNASWLRINSKVMTPPVIKPDFNFGSQIRFL